MTGRSRCSGLRPSVQQYKAESVTNWRFTRINNETVLEMITLCESVRVGDDEFGQQAGETLAGA